MKVEKIAISKLKLDPQNARVHSIRNLEAIMKSLERFGQQKPIVVDKENFVRAGNGTLQAAEKLGWKHVFAQRSELSADEIAAYAISDNRTAELAEWDMDLLVQQLQSFEEETLVEAAGFNEVELLSMLNSDIEEVNDALEEWEGMPAFNQPELCHRTMLVHFEKPESVVAFQEKIGQTFSDKTKFIWFPEAELDKVANTLRYSSEEEGEEDG